jgi:hypothetical protein
MVLKGCQMRIKIQLGTKARYQVPTTCNKVEVRMSWQFICHFSLWSPRNEIAILYVFGGGGSLGHLASGSWGQSTYIISLASTYLYNILSLSGGGHPFHPFIIRPIIHSFIQVPRPGRRRWWKRRKEEGEWRQQQYHSVRRSWVPTSITYWVKQWCYEYNPCFTIGLYLSDIIHTSNIMVVCILVTSYIH